MIEAGDCDLIFMDLRMPDMNDLTGIRQLRAGAHGRRASRSSSPPPPERRHPISVPQAGVTDFLDKATSMEKLFEMVGAFREGHVPVR